MAREFYSASEAAKALGISLDTLRRWDRDGRIETTRDGGNRRRVSAAEVERLRGDPSTARMSPRNRFSGAVTGLRVEGLLARVERLVEGPVRIVAVVTRDAVEDLGLRQGEPATAFVKSTSMMLGH